MGLFGGGNSKKKSKYEIENEWHSLTAGSQDQGVAANRSRVSSAHDDAVAIGSHGQLATDGGTNLDAGLVYGDIVTNHEQTDHDAIAEAFESNRDVVSSAMDANQFAVEAAFESNQFVVDGFLEHARLSDELQADTVADALGAIDSSMNLASSAIVSSQQAALAGANKLPIQPQTIAVIALAGLASVYFLARKVGR